MKLSHLKDFNNLLSPIKNLILIFVKENRLVDAEYRVGSPTTSRLTPRNAGLLDGVKIGSPTRTRVTPGNTASVGDTIVG